MTVLHPLSLVLVAAIMPACAAVPSGEQTVSRAGRPAPESAVEVVSPDCVFPSAPDTRVDSDGLVLRVWSFPLEEVHSQPVLPDDPEFLAFHAAVTDLGVDARTPPLDVPTPGSEAEASVWRDEVYNNRKVYRGENGSIDPISCLDALLFAEQNSRLSQLDYSTEFIASVLRRDQSGVQEVVVIFGAGDSTFPPKSVYGTDIVGDYVRQGWSYWYMLHNHPLQRRGDWTAPGVPVPSTSDVQFARGLAATLGLEFIRVTNGVYTFAASVDDLTSLRQRQ